MLILAALIDYQLLCVYSGVSPDSETMDQVQTIGHNQEIPHK